MLKMQNLLGVQEVLIELYANVYAITVNGSSYTIL